MALTPIEPASAKQVIIALGGVKAVAKLTGALRTSVHNWRAANRFPARYFLVMTKTLRRKGLEAPHWLWSQEGKLDQAA